MKQTYTVAGMHCQACELLLEKKLSAHSEVKSAYASLDDHTVTVHYRSPKQVISVDDLNDELADYGYTVTDEPINEVAWNPSTITTAVATIIVLVFVMLGIESSGLLAQVSLTEESALPAFFVFGLVAGISSCAALVGGLLLSLARQWNQLYGGNDESQRATPFFLFHTGRILAYVFLGGLLGVIGSFFQLSLSATAVLVLVISLVMIMIALQMIAGVPTTVSIENIDVLGCAQAMYMQGLYDEIIALSGPTAEVSFTPQPGTYKISCSMGMVDPVIVTVI